MDAAVAHPRSRAALQILVAERRTGVHLGKHRRGRAVHDDRFAMGRVCERRAALAALHAAAKAWRGVEPIRHLDLGYRHRRLAPRHRGGRLDVLAVEEISQRRYAHGDSVSWPETLAHHLRSRLRPWCRDVGVQRTALDGSVSAPDESSNWRWRPDRTFLAERAAQRPGRAAWTRASRRVCPQAPNGCTCAAR